MTARIHKVIAQSGFASRRRAEVLIAAGRVMVDGATGTHRPEASTRRRRPIEIDGVPLPVKPGLAPISCCTSRPA